MPFDGADGILTGILARANGAPAGRVSTYLILGDRVADQVVSDELGQFELEADFSEGAELWLEVAGDRRIAVAIDPVN